MNGGFFYPNVGAGEGWRVEHVSLKMQAFREIQGSCDETSTRWNA